MTDRPTAAPGHFPYDHRTLADAWADLDKQEVRCTVCDARTDIGVQACAYGRCPMFKGPKW